MPWSILHRLSTKIIGRSKQTPWCQGPHTILVKQAQPRTQPYLCICMSGTYNGNTYGGTCSTATHGFIYIYIHTKARRAASGRRTPRRAAGGRTPRRSAERQAGAVLQMGIRAPAMGKWRMRRGPQRGGRGRVSTRCSRTDICVHWGMAVTYSCYKFVTISLLKRFRNVRFSSETATWIQKCFKKSVGTSRKP